MFLNVTVITVLFSIVKVYVLPSSSTVLPLILNSLISFPSGILTVSVISVFLSICNRFSMLAVTSAGSVSVILLSPQAKRSKATHSNEKTNNTFLILCILTS